MTKFVEVEVISENPLSIEQMEWCFKVSRTVWSVSTPEHRVLFR